MIPLFSLTPTDTNYIRNLLRSSDPKLKLISGADSIHDFFDTVRVPPEAFQVVSTNLIQNLSILTTGQQIQQQRGWKESDYYTNWLSNMSGNKITSSKVEEQTEAYFENELPQFLLGNVAILTYRQVIETINNYKTRGVDNNTSVYNAYKDLCYKTFNTNIIPVDTIEINIESGENWDTAYSTLDKTLIGLFLLNFFFPPPPINATPPIDVAYNTKIPSYMTFDAGSNIPSKIFGLLDQVVNLVTPLNIADSATEGQHLVVDSSQKRAGVKNRYVFPVNESENLYLYNSNIYTMSDGVNLYIEKPQGEYGEKNKYGFNVTANRNNANPSSIIAFTEQDGKTYSAGPGVKYLANMISYTGGELPTPSNSSIAPLTQNINIFNDAAKPKALYYDVKRSGDWEQSMAALTINKLMPNSVQKGRVIFCTLDRLSALFSRCIGQNTIYHTGTRLNLFRYQVYLSPEDMRIATEMAAQALAAIEAAKAQAEAAAQAVIKFERENLLNAAYDLNGKILGIINNDKISQFLLNPENFLTSPIYINKLKQPTQQYAGLYSMINYFGRILFINSLIKLKKVNDEFGGFMQEAKRVQQLSRDQQLSGDQQKTLFDTSQKYLNSIGEITGTLINPLNYLPVIENTILKFLNGFINSGVFLPQGKFCDYDSKMLIDLYVKLQPIVVFNPDARMSKSIDRDNYKMSLETEGVFSTLELISSDSPPNSVLISFVTTFKSLPYNQENTCQQGALSECNKTYYNELSRILNGYINMLLPTFTQRGGNRNVQRGGVISQVEQKNGSDSLMFELTNEFMTLSVSLNEITEFVFMFSTKGEGMQNSYFDFITNMQKLDYPDANKILQILQVFFKNSWDAIKEAEINGINTTEHKKLYYTIYTFFAFLYGTFREPTNNDIESVKIINGLIEYYSNQIREPNYLNDLNTLDIETHKNKKLIIQFLLTNLNFFNDYTDIYDDVSTFGVVINTLLTSDTQVWFTNIITYCLQIRQANKTNAFVLTIFTTLLNYFNFCIYYINKKKNNRISDANLKDFGFNQGYLIISDFTTIGSPIHNLFGKIFRHGIFNPNNNNNDNENESQQNVFKNIPQILSIFSLYFKDPARAIFQLGQIPRGGSNKYTRKKCKLKQIKTRKNNNRKNTIKNFKMKLKMKKTKRNNRIQKNRK